MCVFNGDVCEAMAISIMQWSIFFTSLSGQWIALTLADIIVISLLSYNTTNNK